jgi:putative hemolysin
MRLLTIPADANPSFSKLNLSLATTAEEVKEVQRLRYKVFIESMGCRRCPILRGWIKMSSTPIVIT